MNRKIACAVAGGVVCMLVATAIVISSGIIGVPARSIERDARKSQRIDDRWEVSQSIGDELAAMIFYDGQREEHVFSVYLNRPGLSLGYFFRAGGSTGDMMSGVHMLTYGANGSAILSMNADRVSRVAWENGLGVTGMDVDPSKPFALVVPANCGQVILYNDDGEPIPISAIEGG